MTYISSSGIIAKVLAELKWLNNPEMPAVISVLVLAPAALGLGLISAGTKVITGYWAARGGDVRSRLRAGVASVARGEFSIAIAGMGVALEPRLGSLAATYVLFLAILGPVLARFVR